MVAINKSEVSSQALDGLKITALEDLKKIADTSFINPVYSCNPTPKLLMFNETTTTNTWNRVVPDGKKWRVICGQCSYTATATVGNRIIVFGVGATSSFTIPLVYVGSATALTAGNTRHTNYSNQGTGSNETGTRFIQSIPNVWLTPGMNFRIFDGTGVDSADTMIIRMLVEELPLNEYN